MPRNTERRTHAVMDRHLDHYRAHALGVAMDEPVNQYGYEIIRDEHTNANVLGEGPNVSIRPRDGSLLKGAVWGVVFTCAVAVIAWGVWRVL